MPDNEHTNVVPRRSVVALAGALPLLAACGSSGGTPTDGSAPQNGSAKQPGQPGQPGQPAQHGQESGGGAGGAPALAATSDVPVGGALVVSGQNVVVTQPEAGDFHCFSAACTHAGCPVKAGPTLDCPCHGSSFSITDGSVLRGPARSPLPSRRITVKGGDIRLA